MGLKAILNHCRNFFLFGLKYRWVRIGRNMHCQSRVFFWSPRKHIVFGDDIAIGYNSLFLSDAEIGNKVLIAPLCAFLNRDDHRYDIVGKTILDSGRGDKYKIVIEDDVWIGYGSTILSKVRIGRGSIVATASLVTEDVPPYTIVGGMPARKIRMRFSREQILQHEQILVANGEMTDSERTNVDALF